jgi:hypothetical protein
MKYKLIFIILLSFYSCSYSQPEQKEYFIRPCEFVCDYPFNDTTKWVITCRVWGLLKYYHPNVTAGKLDWDAVLLDRLDDISSSSQETINRELKKMLDKAGEYEYQKADEWNDSLKMNVNLCWLDNSFLDDTLRNELKKIASLTVEQPSYYGVDFDSTRHPIAQNEKVYPYFNSYEQRLLTLFRCWNVIYYFFPHKYLLDQSWDKTLSEFVFPFINATDRDLYQSVFLKFTASLNDGHSYLSTAHYYPNESMDLLEKVGEKTVVKIDGGGLYKGDIVHSVGDRDIDHIRDSLSVLIPASTPGNKEYRINCYVAEMIFFQKTDIAVSRDGKIHHLHLLPFSFEEKPPVAYERVSNDIGYVNLSLLTTEKMDSMFQSFSDAKGIIFDLRKVAGPYNYDVHLYECYLSDNKSIRMSPTVLWDMEHPGAFVEIENVRHLIPDSLECTLFKGKIVYLINEATQSFLETQAFVARTNFHATLIGHPTSGALGQVVWIVLPGHCRVSFSGAGLFSLDWSELQRRGITPDIEVYPTMESIKAGKDEILEAAIEYLNKN